MQEFGTRANAIWGSLAKAPREVQQQFAFLNSEAAKLQSNALAVSQEMFRLSAAMDAAKSSTVSMASSVSSATGSLTQTRLELQALESVAGVRVPRAMTTMLARFGGVAEVVNAAFPVVGALFLVDVIGQLIESGKKWIDTLGGMNSQMKDLYDSEVKLNQAAFHNFPTVGAGQKVVGENAGSQSKLSARISTDQSVALGPLLTPTGDPFTDLIAQAAQFYTAELNINKAQTDYVKGNLQSTADLQRLTQLERDRAEAAIRYQSEIDEAGLQGFALLAQKHADEIKLINQQYSGEKADAQLKNDAVRASDAQYAAARIELQRQIHDQTIALENEAALAGLTGVQKIEAEKAIELQKTLDYLKREGAANEEIQAQMLAVDQKYQAQIEAQRLEDFNKEAAQMKAHEDQMADLRKEAALAGVPEQQRATAQIVLDEQQRIDKLNVLDADYEQQKELIQQIANDKLADAQQKQLDQQQQQYQRSINQMSNSLYQMFNDITSGNIGSLIKEGFTKLFANIAAQWLYTLGIMGGNGGRSGGGAPGFIASLLGSFFGIGGGAGATAGAGSGPYGLPPGVAASFQDGGNGSISADEMAQLNSLQLGVGAGGAVMGGPGSLSTSSIEGALATAAIGGVLSPTSVGPAGSVPQQKPTGLAAIGSLASLQKLVPLGLLGALMLGQKGGASAIAAGSLVSALGIGALLTNGPALAAVAPFAGLIGPLAGGLIGFGLGSSFGPLAGILGGAAAGAATGAGVSLALTGTLLGLGPATLGISAAIGAIAGLIGALFGGGPSKHTLADRYINANILPAIKQELTGYEGFQIDYSTAINTLDQMKQQSFDTLHQQFGKDAATDEWNRLVVPAITQAEQTINTDEAERERRQGLLFGPPQFANGGIFSSGGPGGAGVAILHDGETVMTRAATNMFGASTFLAMNSLAKSGAAVLGSTLHVGAINISAQTIDRNWLRNGGAVEILSAVRRALMEGH